MPNCIILHCIARYEYLSTIEITNSKITIALQIASEVINNIIDTIETKSNAKSKLNLLKK